MGTGDDVMPDGRSVGGPIGQPVDEVLESISDAFIALDGGERFTYVNRAAERLLRQPRAGLFGRVIWEAFPGAAGTAFQRELRRAAGTGETARFEEYYPPFGSWFEVRAYPTPGGLAVYFQDVGERRRMQDALREEVAFRRAIESSIATGVAAVSLSGALVYVNPSFCRMTGFAEDRLLGSDAPFPFWPPEESDRLLERFRGMLGGEPPSDLPAERPVVRADGSRFAASVSVAPLRGAGGEVTGYVAFYQDLTDLKRSSAALEQSERRYRSLVDASASIVWTTDAKGAVVVPSPSWEAFTGQPPDRQVGWGWLDAVHPGDRDRAASAWTRAVAAGGPYEDEYRLSCRGGGYCDVVARGVPVPDAGGAVREWVGTCTDVTEARRAERDLRAAKDAAERASRAKDEFIAVLSHELRTPLTPVLLAASLLEGHPGLPADLRDDVASIRRNVELESRLIGDLLDLTRVTRGVLHLDPREVDLHEVVRTAIAVCQREESVVLAVDLAAERHVVRGDPARLQQVFWNLINNAQKFSPAGGVVTVRSLDAPGGRVRVEVADRGQGIDPEVLPRLFSAFEQGDVRTTRKFAGLGLGLAISKKLVEAHGGAITAGSPGKGLGATIAVELPGAASPAEARGRAPDRPADRDAAPGGDGAEPSLRVLLVEDHEATLRALARLLTRLGYRIRTASTVSTALAIAERESFDVLVSDLGLPDGSGLDLMRALRDRYAHRGIALTGYGMADDVRMSLEAGFAEHITKPVDLDTLRDAIRRVATPAEG